MSRSFKDLKVSTAEADAVAVGMSLNGETDASSSCGSVDDVGISAGRKFKVARKKVGVEMSLNNFCDREAVSFSIGEVLVDIALWIDDHSVASRFIGDEVARVGQTVEVVLLEEHGRLLCLALR